MPCDTVELRLGNSAAIVAAADAVGKAAHEFAEQADGKQLAAIDALVAAAESVQELATN